MDGMVTLTDENGTVAVRDHRRCRPVERRHQRHQTRSCCRRCEACRAGAGAIRARGPGNPGRPNPAMPARPPVPCGTGGRCHSGRSRGAPSLARARSGIGATPGHPWSAPRRQVNGPRSPSDAAPSPVGRRVSHTAIAAVRTLARGQAVRRCRATVNHVARSVGYRLGLECDLPPFLRGQVVFDLCPCCSLISDSPGRPQPASSRAAQPLAIRLLPPDRYGKV